jgi:prefoldin alpha subunit
MTDESPEKLSERDLVINIQILQEQAKILASNVEMLTMYLQEMVTSKLTLEGIQNLKPGDEILVPIGASSFIRARIDDTEKVIVGVGADVSVDRASEDAVQNLEERISLTQERIKENQENYMKVTAKLEELNAEAQKVIQQKGDHV